MNQAASSRTAVWGRSAARFAVGAKISASRFHALLAFSIILCSSSAGVIAYAEKPAVVHKEQRRVFAEFKLEGVGSKFIVFPVKMGDKSISAVLDTGAEVSMYDSSLAELLGRGVGATEIRTPQGSKMCRLYPAPDVSIGGTQMLHRSGLVLCDDITGLCRVSNQRFQAVLGMDLLGKSIIRLDLLNGSLAFVNAVDLPETTAIRLSRQGTAPCALVSFAGAAPEPFVIDTAFIGADAGCRAELFSTLYKDGRLVLRKYALAQDQAIIARTREGRIRGITAMGPHRRDQASVTETSGNRIGPSFFKGRLLVFDFPRDLMFVVKGEEHKVITPSRRPSASERPGPYARGSKRDASK